MSNHQDKDKKAAIVTAIIIIVTLISLALSEQNDWKGRILKSFEGMTVTNTLQ